MSEQERETMKELIELTKKVSDPDKMYILGVAQGMAIKSGQSARPAQEQRGEQ